MNKFLRLLIILQLVIPKIALADCDFANDIKKQEDGSYLYKPQCHIEVGKRLQELKLRQEQVTKLEKIIELKDLAITIQESRANMWMDTTLKVEERLNAIERTNKTQNIYYFLGGVALTGVAIYGAAQLGKSF